MAPAARSIIRRLGIRYSPSRRPSRRPTRRQSIARSFVAIEVNESWLHPPDRAHVRANSAGRTKARTLSCCVTTILHIDVPGETDFFITNAGNHPKFPSRAIAVSPCGRGASSGRRAGLVALVRLKRRRLEEAEQVRLDLLKSTYRLEPASPPKLYELANTARGTHRPRVQHHTVPGPKWCRPERVSRLFAR